MQDLILDFGDAAYDKVLNEWFHQKPESVQCNAALAMTGAIRGTNTEKLYQELGLESLQYRCKLQKVGNRRKFIGSKGSCENKFLRMATHPKCKQR